MNKNPTSHRLFRTLPILLAAALLATVLLATVLLAAVLLPAVPLAAQQETAQDDPASTNKPAEHTIVIDPDARSQLRLAFPKATFDASLRSTDQEIAREIEQTLRDDLDFSGVFNIQGPTELAVLSLTGERQHDFEQYESLNNELLLRVTIKRDGEKIALEGRYYDLPSRQVVDGKRYRGQPSQARRIAHTLADAIYHQFTGQPGIALTLIAFQSDRDGDNRQELYLMDYDGRNQRRISTHKSTSGFSDWSPSGDALAYMSTVAGSPGIYFVDLDTSKKIPVYQEGTLNISPSFSPDGKQIVFAHSTETNVDIYVCERDCQSPRRLTTSKAIDTNPAWSPDGSQIAFTSNRSGKPNVYVMGIDGSGTRRISFEGDYNDGACWRPDGTYLVYSSRRGGYRFQVTETNLVDLATRTLTEGPESYEQPCYSPDGRRIVFTVMRGREAQIHVMTADGGDWRQLTHEGNNMAADWSNFMNK